MDDVEVTAAQHSKTHFCIQTTFFAFLHVFVFQSHQSWCQHVSRLFWFGTCYSGSAQGHHVANPSDAAAWRKASNGGHLVPLVIMCHGTLKLIGQLIFISIRFHSFPFDVFCVWLSFQGSNFHGWPGHDNSAELRTPCALRMPMQGCSSNFIYFPTMLWNFQFSYMFWNTFHYSDGDKPNLFEFGFSQGFSGNSFSSTLTVGAWCHNGCCVYSS